jgi:hypothetical protein
MILYALICRRDDTAVLADCVCDSELRGSFSQVFVELLHHLRDHPGYCREGDLRTFVQRNDSTDFFLHFLDACTAFGGGGDEGGGEEDSGREHYFQVFLKNGIFYGCLADDPDPRDQKVYVLLTFVICGDLSKHSDGIFSSLPHRLFFFLLLDSHFAFLQHVQREFTKLYRQGRIQRSNAYAMNSSFGPAMRSAMHYHNTHHRQLRQEEKVKRIQAQVEDMKTVVGRNIEVLLQRGEKFDSMLDRSENLRADAAVFKKRTVRNRRIQRRRYWIWLSVLGFVVVVLLYLAVIGVCGTGLKYCRRNASNGGGSDNSNSDNSSSSSSNNNNNNNNNNGDQQQQQNDQGEGRLLYI